MSYPIDLDEYTEEQLVTELRRRLAARKAGKCDYCNRPPTEPTCKFPERHRPMGCRCTEKGLYLWNPCGIHGFILRPS